jgi:hypothetical protein
MRVTRRRTRSAANSGRRSTVVVAVSGPQSDANKFEGKTEDTPSLGIELLAVKERGDRHTRHFHHAARARWSETYKSPTTSPNSTINLFYATLLCSIVFVLSPIS